MSVDRLQELRRRKQKGSTAGAGTRGAADDVRIDMPEKEDVGTQDIEGQVKLYAPINQMILEIAQSTEQLNALKGRDNKTTDEKQRKKIMDEMRSLVNSVMAQAKEVKNNLTEIKEANEKFDGEQGNQNSARSQVRNNLYQATVRRFQDTMNDFTQAREGFRQNIQERMVRQIKIVDSSKSDAEIQQLVESGEADQIIQKALVSDSLREVVYELKARNHELLMLQRNVESLYEMFKDLHTLIELQGESLNVIEARINRSLDYVVEAQEHLENAKVQQTKSRKLKCILLFIALAILVIVLVPVLLTSL